MSTHRPPTDQRAASGDSGASGSSGDAAHARHPGQGATPGNAGSSGDPAESGGLDPALAGQLDQRLFPPAPGDEALLARVLGRVMDGVRAEAGAAGHLTIRAREGEWQELAPGVRRKVLHVGNGVVSALLRLDPGVVVDGHAHPIDEECLVLDGTLRIGDGLLLHAGDFHLGRRGVPHAAASTESGALVYLRGAAEPA